MLRDFPYTIWLMFLGIVLLFVTGYYYQTSYNQDSVMQGMTESIRTTAIENIDNGSRIEPGKIHLMKDDFEEDFKKTVKKSFNTQISEEATFQFEYLKDTNGSIKAIRVIVTDGERSYQATTKVNISES